MKKIIIMMIAMIVLTPSLFAQQSEPTLDNGYGTLEVVVEYPELTVKFNSANHNGYQGENNSIGVIDIGPLNPPALSECYPDDDGYSYKYYGKTTWSDTYIPFVVEGAKGISFVWSVNSTAPVLVSGDPGVKLAFPNFMGSNSGAPYSYNAIPDGSGYVETLSHSTGLYYIQMHFAWVAIRFACTAGDRVFESTITCDYN